MKFNRFNRSFVLKRSLTVFLIVMQMAFAVHAQENSTERQHAEGSGKFESFISKKGAIIKFQDFNLPSLKSSFGEISKNRIRKVSLKSEAQFFFQIEKRAQYSSTIASIAYDDLLELLRALSRLESEVADDVNANPDYLENRFATSDGFEIGYYVTKGKSDWYLKLKHGSDNTLFISGSDLIKQAFEAAKTKIQELQK